MSATDGNNFTEDQKREMALHNAVASSDDNASGEDIVKKAEAYFQFLSGDDKTT